MAATLGTLGTANTTSLSAIVWGTMAGISAANFSPNYVQDIALLNAKMTYPDQPNAVYSEGTTYEKIIGYAGSGVNAQCGMIQNGMLYIPSRGWLPLLPGDVVAVDANTGWPVLINYATSQSNKWHVVNNS